MGECATRKVVGWARRGVRCTAADEGEAVRGFIFNITPTSIVGLLFCRIQKLTSFRRFTFFLPMWVMSFPV